MSEFNHDADCDCGCNDEFDTMTLTLDDGSEIECGVLAIFPVQNKQYIALVPLNEEDDSEEGEVYLYCYVEDEDGEIQLINIEEDDEYEAVADAFDELLDSEDFDQLFDGEDE